MVEVDHPTRGKYLTVGNPVKMSDSITEVKRSPLLGEHTEEILTRCSATVAKEIEEIKTSGAITAPEKKKRRRDIVPRLVPAAAWGTTRLSEPGLIAAMKG